MLHSSISILVIVVCKVCSPLIFIGKVSCLSIFKFTNVGSKFFVVPFKSENESNKGTFEKSIEASPPIWTRLVVKENEVLLNNWRKYINETPITITIENMLNKKPKFVWYISSFLYKRGKSTP